MLETVSDIDGIVARWVSKHIAGGHRGFNASTALGIVEDGELVAGVVYHDYNPEAGIIEISAASTSKRWLSRPVLLTLFSYPFDGVGVQMLVMRTEVGNQQDNGRGMARLSKAYGFTQILIPRLYGRDKDGLLHCLTAEAWRANGFHPENEK
jgi:RimJ/RimL family protein N-acetyltransferase